MAEGWLPLVLGRALGELEEWFELREVSQVSQVTRVCTAHVRR